MKLERLKELAGVKRLNESSDMNSLVVKHIADIVTKTILTDKYFKGMKLSELNDEIELMVGEQFDVLAQDLSKQTIELIKLSIQKK